MSYKPNMPPKLNTIFTLGNDKKYVSVVLKDGRTIQCISDCYCYVSDDNDENTDILALNVFYKDQQIGEILIEDDIESVTEL